MNYPLLFSPKKIGAVEIKNRGVMTAMGVGLAKDDGTATGQLVAYFAERAEGGVGLIITEFTRVNDKDGISTGKQLSLAKNKHIASFKKITKAVHEHETKLFVQLCHPGRETLSVFPGLWPLGNALAKVIPGYWRFFYKIMATQDRESLNDPKMVKLMQTFMPKIKAPSNVPAGLGFSPYGNQLIKEFTIEEIKQVTRQFAAAAKRAQTAGVDGVELHAGHGYLFNQFLSPATNLRKDKYGGSLENRTRILKEVIAAIKADCGADFPVIVRLTVDECYARIGYPKMGITLPEGIALAKAVENCGADALNVTIGNVETQAFISEPVSFAPGWRQYLVEAVKQAVSLPVIAVGVIRTPEQAEAILTSGTQDFIGLGRPLLADPFWLQKAQTGKMDEISRCLSCLACQESYEVGMSKGTSVICAVNPRVGQEIRYPLAGPKDGNNRKVVIVGAGVAGLTAARELARRNFNVVVFEQEKIVGGQINLAIAPPHKEKIGWASIDLAHQAQKAGAKIHYGRTATVNEIARERPYAVFMATGATTLKPKLPGAEQAHVFTPTPILKGQVAFSNKEIVVIGSGMTGLETAELLMEQGNHITIIEQADKICPAGYAPNVWDVTERLKKNQTDYKTGRRLVQIHLDTIITLQHNRVREVFPADVVVLALGVRSENQLGKQLVKHFEQVIFIGDAEKTGRIAQAIHSGFKAARKLS
jgi:2,4-dienoyl-CoA reductase-like NADH-dependent reductase (Old Yellow Enzyme family)/thioredoxin reductase